ncbi:subclass B1 metallo-beta-lactamase [Candidatus Latescibacterota bacterium]
MIGFKYLLRLILFIVFSSIIIAQDNTIKISDDLELIRLSDKAFIHTSYKDMSGYEHLPANGLVYIDDGKAFIVDTPWDDALTKMLVDWLRDNLAVEIEGVIVTHWHVDCMGGLNEIHKRGIKTYLQNLTREIAAREKLPVPENGFDTKLTLYINDKEIIAGYFGAGHTIDNIVVWVPAEKILFGGCMMKTLGSRGLGNTDDADLTEWPKTVNKVLERYSDAEIVIPGHGQYGDIKIIHHTLQLLQLTE